MVLSEREKPSLSVPNGGRFPLFGKKKYPVIASCSAPLFRWTAFFIFFFVCVLCFFFASSPVFGEKNVIANGGSQISGKRMEGAMTYDPKFLRKEASGMSLDIEVIEEDVSESEQVRELREYLETRLADYPISAMIPAIVQKDLTVAAFLVGIAKKESDWGKHVPLSDNGKDCYNYWGYRAPGSLGTQRSGYGCFATPEEAIDVVGSRIETLAVEYKRDTPDKMVVWKCGFNCTGHDPASVAKWISDVALYHRSILALADASEKSF
jgi:hypothetical protein